MSVATSMPGTPSAEPAATESVDRSESVRHSAVAIPVVEETLQVDKTVVDQGGYRVAKRIVTRQESIDELLRNERVDVERRPMGVQLSQIPELRYEGDTLIVPVVEEVLIVEKRLMLVEEVRVRRRTGTHREVQQVSLRKEEISIERLAAESSAGNAPQSPAPAAGTTPDSGIQEIS